MIVHPSIDLSGIWQFYMGPAEEAVFSGGTVRLPGAMDENRKGRDNSGNVTPRHLHRDFVYTGPAAYRREVAVPADWAGRPVILYLERTKKTRVWVDGRPAGPQCKSCTTPHRYDLTSLCRPGHTHTLTVEVDNSPAGMPHAMYSTLWEGEAWSHQLTEHGQTNWNGIVGELKLESPPALSVSALRLRPDVEARAVRAELVLTRLNGEKELRGEVVLRAESWNASRPVHKTARQRAAFRFAPGENAAALSLIHPMGEHPLLWDEFHPNLYRVTAEVCADGVLWDAAAEKFRRSCCELTVLARLPRFVWEGGETLAAEIVVSNYSPAPAELAAVWVVEDGLGTELSRGSLPARAVPQGGVTGLGTIHVELPRLSAPRALRLTLALEGEWDAPYAPGVNDYPLWLYPAAPAPEVPKGVVVRRAYDRTAEEALARGGRVLILSEGTAAALPHSRAVSFRPDFWSPMFHTNSPDGYSLGIFVDKNHPLFTGFPTDCFGDWQWFEPLQGARGLRINRLPAGLRPMVQPIASIDQPDRLALFFEARVGEGRLFVSTIDLTEKSGPASRALLAAVYRYVDSGIFQPGAALEPEALRPCLPPLDLTEIRLNGKAALGMGERADYEIAFFDSRGPCGKPEGKAVEFRSENPAVLEVDEAGRARAVGEGVSKLTAACFDDTFRFTHSIAVRVGEAAARPIPLEGAKLAAQSSHPEHPEANLLNDDPAAWWQTDYLDRAQRLPQWLSVELRPAREICALLCGAWTGSTRGAGQAVCLPAPAIMSWRARCSVPARPIRGRFTQGRSSGCCQRT